MAQVGERLAQVAARREHGLQEARDAVVSAALAGALSHSSHARSPSTVKIEASGPLSGSSSRRSGAVSAMPPPVDAHEYGHDRACASPAAASAPACSRHSSARIGSESVDTRVP